MESSLSSPSAASSVSSGYFGGNFAIMNSDGAARLGGKNIKRHLITKNAYNTTDFLPNKLYLDFDLYYFSIALIEADGYFNVEYSLDGTNWIKFKTFVLNQGNPLFWSKNALDLDALGVPRSANIKFRFSLFSRGLSSGGYYENVATLDNVKLWGSIPVDRDYEWSGADAGVLYDKTCTTLLGTTLAREVCVKPSGVEYEKPSWTFYASANFQNGCPAVGSTTVYNDTKVWNQPSKTNWNQADDDWKPSGIPTIKKCVIVRTPVELPSLTTGTHGLARSVIVKSGGKLTIDSKSSLTIQNYLKNEAAASDVLVESDANLLQINNSSVNEGNITVKRNANLQRLDYNYWGSPVKGQTFKPFSPYTKITRFYTYDPRDDSFVTVADLNSEFIEAKGYAIMAPDNYNSTTQIFEGKFVGMPNNGVKQIALDYSAHPVTGVYGGRNMIANPYPSNIDLKKFDLLDEVRKSALSAVKVMLPDEEIIGDPFWTVMETEQDSDKNTGNYEMVNDSILLFLSKKQAINYCSKIKKSAKVFGISQNHLKVLVSLQEKSMFPDFSIAIPEFEQLQENSILCYTIPHKSLKKFYLRGDNNE